MFQAVVKTSYLKCTLLVLSMLALSVIYWLGFKLPEKPQLSGSFQSAWIEVDKLRRSYSFYVPQKIDAMAPLVLVLHGSRGDSDQARKAYSYRFDSLADQHGFIVVYPDGFENHWNDCRLAGPYAANLQNINDTEFLTALEQRVRSQHQLQSKQTLITGLSNGGHMTLRMALERPSASTVYVPLIANMPAAANMGCKEKRQAVSIAFMNGTDDPLNPYDGGQVALFGIFSPRGLVLSTDESVAYWLELAGLGNHLEHSWVVTGAHQQASQIRVSYWNSAGKPLVGLFSIVGGGHTVASKTSHQPRILGITNSDADAADLIWQFYLQVSAAKN